MEKLLKSGEMGLAAPMGPVASTTALIAKGLALNFSDIHRDLYEAGVKGVRQRDNMVDLTMDSAGYMGAAFAGTELGSSALSYLAEEDMLPFLPEGMSPEAREVAAKDIGVILPRMASMPVGFLAAVLHPDMFGGIGSVVRGADATVNAYRVLAKSAEGTRLGSLADRRGLWAIGDGAQ